MLETVVIFLLLLASSALFSGIEIAFFSLTPGRVRTMVRQNLPAAKLVERLKQRPRRLLITVLIGNNLVNISAAAIATELALSLFGSEGVAIATGTVTFLVLVFGEIFPKSFAQQHPGAVSRYTAHFIYALTTLLSPLAWAMEKLMDFFASRQATKDAIKVEEEEIRSLFQIGHEKGLIEEHEREFAERLFRFNDSPISSIMKSPDKAYMLDGDSLVSQAAREAAPSGYSRFPVFKKDRSAIIGVVHVKDILKELVSERKNDPLVSIIQTPLYAAATDKLDDVFRMMREGRTHYALVRDANAAVVGLVTLEDILEELVGEIYDESDRLKKGLVT